MTYNVNMDGQKTHILNVEKTERWSFATIVNRLGGESLVDSVHKIELTKYVGELGRDARYFHNDDAKFKRRAEF